MLMVEAKEDVGKDTAGCWLLVEVKLKVVVGVTWSSVVGWYLAGSDAGPGTDGLVSGRRLIFIDIVAV